jgi:hypothetical protein
MFLSLVGAIFVALKGWLIWWCWDVTGAVPARGGDGRRAAVRCKCERIQDSLRKPTFSLPDAAEP